MQNVYWMRDGELITQEDRGFELFEFNSRFQVQREDNDYEPIND